MHVKIMLIKFLLVFRLFVHNNHLSHEYIHSFFSI